MRAGFAPLAALALAAMLGGCASTTNNGGAAALGAGAEVTRFHLGQDMARGEIAVEPLEQWQAGSPDFARYAAAVERELANLGWTIVRGGARSEQVALIRVDQGTAAQLETRPGATSGIGGSLRSAAAPSGGTTATELAVRLQRRSDGTAIWEGRARTAGTMASPTAPDRLALALFQGFPGDSGRTIRTP